MTDLVSHAAFLNVNVSHNGVVIHYLSSLFVCLEHTQTLINVQNSHTLPLYIVGDFVFFMSLPLEKKK